MSTRIFIPAPCKQLSANRPITNKGYKQSIIRMWQDAAIYSARAAHVRKIETPTRCIAVIQRPDQWRIYDPNNWAPTTKAVIDGLVKAGILVEDNANVLQGPDHRKGGAGPLGLHLIFTDWEKTL